MSVTSLSKLISTRKEELARLLEWRGTNFPVVERQNDLRISFIELELEDLEKLNDQPQLNENQQIVLEYLKYRFGKYDDVFVRSIFSPIYDLISECWDDELNTAFEQLDLKQEIQVLEVFGQWALEQENQQ
ncbi:hypothetical protein [uncultured Enterococcus sp.]|uniref:hypothetical protein n=1 Tax=uncultured Enterococcus sp. TaxID=167972 RepID=UPI0025989E20|nr:hypothetical protein [uncultured Enterococcus sp.]